MSPGIGLMDRRLKTEKDAISLAMSGVLKKYKIESKEIEILETKSLISYSTPATFSDIFINETDI